MATNEKEYNGYLYDQLHMLKRLKRTAKAKGYDDMVSAIEYEETDVKEKLYQNPPLTSE